MYIWGVRGRVVRVIDIETLVLHHCGFESRHELVIFSFEEATQLPYWTSVALVWCPLVPEKMHRGPPRSSPTSKTGNSPCNKTIKRHMYYVHMYNGHG